MAMMRRLGAPEQNILIVQGNLANAYASLDRHEDALQMSRDVYSGRLRLHGEEHESTIRAALNYAASLGQLQRFGEAKSLLRKTIPVAQRVLGVSNDTALRMRWAYAGAICNDTAATLDDLHEAVTTLEDVERTARRVLGGAHPLTADIERALQHSRAALAAREGDDASSV